MNANLSAILYLIAGVLFILSLRGLSSPETSRRGNYLGIAGMAIAIITTLLQTSPDVIGWLLIIVGTVGIGLLIGEGTVLPAEGVPDIEIVVNALLMVSGIGLIL